ncbi:DUF1127 domain-containing protein [Cognatishimia sp. F0-27]|uniref:DUF1127 domain-containing protein n=1 Tax=Cognatishimia sp. F0-27 TaxID=2816855 RepID=UPI001D0C06F4|nr:DUF1127 domain-containing protein [Cognatishimia sp. F0-27]MCC1492656.1 DUF1127 domain-containing protein [Cognatishimia sp. F0-27]
MQQSIAPNATSAATLFVEPSSQPVFGKIGFWIARARQRRMLSTLDRARLDDIGVSPAEAMIEAAKPFWKD